MTGERLGLLAGLTVVIVAAAVYFYKPDRVPTSSKTAPNTPTAQRPLNIE